MLCNCGLLLNLIIIPTRDCHNIEPSCSVVFDAQFDFQLHAKQCAHCAWSRAAPATWRYMASNGTAMAPKATQCSIGFYTRVNLIVHLHTCMPIEQRSQRPRATGHLGDDGLQQMDPSSHCEWICISESSTKGLHLLDCSSLLSHLQRVCLLSERILFICEWIYFLFAHTSGVLQEIVISKRISSSAKDHFILFICFNIRWSILRTALKIWIQVLVNHTQERLHHSATLCTFPNLFSD